jgi:hypothetical protein
MAQQIYDSTNLWTNQFLAQAIYGPTNLWFNQFLAQAIYGPTNLWLNQFVKQPIFSPSNLWPNKFMIQPICEPTNLWPKPTHDTNNSNYIWIGVLTEMSMKITAFWEVAPYSLVEVYHYFEGKHFLHPSGSKLYKQQHAHSRQVLREQLEIRFRVIRPIWPSVPSVAYCFRVATGLVKIMLTLMDYFSPADRRTP